ncbi:MAG: aldehyde dehydrogenase (NADP(+)) [Magnetovibrio sp.]|nr:aldehyde dehydrogenase (NADP(+)) [Magnetovibrio sp.]
MLNGKHLIAGQWVSGDETFQSKPAHGPSHAFAVGTPELVNDACLAAEEAFWSYGYSSRQNRAKFLNTIADKIEERGADLTEIGTQETGLPEARLNGERGRTTGQLRLFAEHILSGDYLDRRFDEALPDRAPLPRPDLRMMQRPIGPIAVFGSSNFPLAFSTAGGDTAAALAAGCPVVVKGHSAHPGTGEIVAQAIHEAIKDCDLHPGVFSFVQGGTREVGQTLVKHPLIKAVGFTGSLGGGRALFDLCAARPEPIPFFGELGSVNPMFLLPHALSHRGDEIATGWAGSLTMGAGQFCTKPGVCVVIEGADASAFAKAVTKALAPFEAQTMLTDGIAKSYRDGRDRIAGAKGIRDLLTTSCDQRTATPYLFQATAKEWLDNQALGEEVFGPLGLIIVADNFEEMMKVARTLEGQLTCTLHLDAEDSTEGRALLPILERKAGRLLANGFPTGVEVSSTMVHGGPYPASTNFGATSVGTLSIRRFVRPVCYQNIPTDILPEDIA